MLPVSYRSTSLIRNSAPLGPQEGATVYAPPPRLHLRSLSAEGRRESSSAVDRVWHTQDSHGHFLALAFGAPRG